MTTHQDPFNLLFPKVDSRPTYTKNDNSSFVYSKSFRLFNSTVLSLDELKLQLDNYKDNIIHLRNTLCIQNNQYNSLSKRRAIIKTHLLGNANVIQTVLSANNNNKLMNSNNGYTSSITNNSNSSNCINNKHTTPLTPISPLSTILSPKLKTSKYNFLNAVEQTNTTLENQIKLKDYELKTLRNTKSVSRLNILNLDYNSSNIQLAELKRNYDLLKFQYDELKLRLNKTIEQRDSYQANVSRYKLQCKQYARIEKKLINSSSTRSSSSGSNYTPINSNQKEMVDAKQTVAMLKRKIEDLLLISRRNEYKVKDIKSRMGLIEQNSNNTIMTIDQMESEMNQLSLLKTENDLKEVIGILNNDIDILKQTLNELNENYNRENKKIGEYQRNTNDIECELNKKQAQNMVLMEIVTEDKERIDYLSKVDNKNKGEIQQLQNELDELKEKGQTDLSQKI